MAMLHAGQKRHLTDAEAREFGLEVRDSYADYGYTAVPFTADDRPDLEERLAAALKKAGLTNNRMVGWSSAGTNLHRVEMAPDGTRGVAVLETRYPMGD
jgi:hypothetical protein